MVRERRYGAESSYYLETRTGEGLSIPVWMTEPAARLVHETNRKYLNVTTLLQISTIVQRGLESIGVPEKDLLSDQTKENLNDRQTTPVILNTGSLPASPASDGRGLRQKYRGDRKNASSRGRHTLSPACELGGKR